MTVHFLNGNVSSSYLGYSFTSDTLSATVTGLFDKTIRFAQEETQPFAFLGACLSSIGTIYSYIYDNTQQWMLYATACVICLAAAYRQGWLEQSLDRAKAEIQEIKSQLSIAYKTLSDREALLSTLDATQQQLKESTALVDEYKQHQKELSKELDDIREDRKKLTDTVTQLTAITLFFHNLKHSYPDEKVFLEHLSSITTLTQSVQEHLKTSQSDTATYLVELKNFLEGLNKQEIDHMALLQTIHKTTLSIQQGVVSIEQGVISIEQGVIKANTQLDKIQVG